MMVSVHEQETITIDELEEVCMALDGNVKKVVLKQRELLASLPSYPRGKEYKSDCARCLLTCQSLCGRIEASAHIADEPNMWCPYCGKMTYWKVSHRLV